MMRADQTPTGNPLNDEEPDEMVLFHYTSLETAQRILESGNIRLGPYALTNDPRETKEWVAEVLLAAGSASHAPLGEADSAGERADELLRRGARLACFTVDRERRQEAPGGSLFHRGWARPNMWAHYGQNHHGICLVLARHLLVGQVDAYRPVGNGDVFSCGRVAYADSPIRIPVDLDEVRHRGIEAVLDDYQTRRGVVGELYFTKNTDWSSEQEFRIIVVRWDVPKTEWDEPLYVPLGSSLVAIVGGEATDESTIGSLRSAPAVGSAVSISRCLRERGMPTLVGT